MLTKSQMYLLENAVSKLKQLPLTDAQIASFIRTQVHQFAGPIQDDELNAFLRRHGLPPQEGSP
jgi:hypothetical protein